MTAMNAKLSVLTILVLMISAVMAQACGIPCEDTATCPSSTNDGGGGTADVGGGTSSGTPSGDGGSGGTGGTTTGVGGEGGSTGGAPPCIAAVRASHHTCARKSDGALSCWGNNSSSQLGDATTQNKSTPNAVVTLGATVARVGVGYYHTCARRQDGTVACWGKNNYGQLGDGTLVDKSTPVAVASLGANVDLIGLGTDHSCATKTDGSLWCWGYNSFGQVGNGSTTDQSTPVQIPGAPAAVDGLALGAAHSCVTASDGTLWCWGRNADGQVGDGTTVNRSTPVQVASLGATALRVSPGWHHTCALKNDDSVWCWGDNSYGQLGTGSAVDSNSPVATATLGSTVVEVASGGYHSCARKADGSVWCWGLNATGQLGDGTTENKTSPVEVATLGGSAVGIAAGVDYTCAWMEDDALFCWGGNSFGQLGDGTTQDKTSPVEVNLCP